MLSSLWLVQVFSKVFRYVQDQDGVGHLVNQWQLYGVDSHKDHTFLMENIPSPIIFQFPLSIRGTLLEITPSSPQKARRKLWGLADPFIFE